jgi:sensor histidine kinase regulating citrate/malate metabolism
MIEIQLILMNVSIIALCVAVLYMRKYVMSITRLGIEHKVNYANVGRLVADFHTITHRLDERLKDLEVKK